ncbi:2-oxoglutarate dehydrogenase complex dihydrolipoyllysine-residue succinyltransferase [Minwuia thermotolerans]|uniref:Dihydrolipoyllysine-residue succinyltransferase component of 2-oxoglutarate dehydrogenase complex n=1 Tax=Minwuia thermotolerans TaxID=2056226 RepID=A0A2M9FZQ8_9PROT|nr:2-oxoglutarate dehydrogenase complex dihydrolipoyllysine-residue succinyltransferase [Minwuia thermotolerans]PJK28946.1 dihydrolipoyllysine-residue succinyltransferase [Minwuia thermotolerans]
MAVEIKVPTMGESITEATVGQWFKKEGDAVAVDDPLCELETDKVTLEVNATSAGALAEIVAEEGATVEVGALLCRIDESAEGTKSEDKPKAKDEAPKEEKKAADDKPKQDKAPEKKDAAPKRPAKDLVAMDSAKALADEKGVSLDGIEGTGKDGRVTRADVARAIAEGRAKQAERQRSSSGGSQAALAPESMPGSSGPRPEEDREERVRMSRLRRTIARRLKEAQNTAAMLTTFNEVDMTEVLALRSAYKDDFEKKHGVRLGFMAFFIKACIAALKELPAVNAEIDGDDIVYKNYYHIGVAVGTPNGLVVPVVRDADQKSVAGIESTIADLGTRARDGKLGLDELQGGTFTISNGGVYGSLMSTPILNPPQSGILGMHKIQQRPMEVGGEIKLRPMMYLALSYDHRIIDGREAVLFLVKVKENLEDPRRLILDL